MKRSTHINSITPDSNRKFGFLFAVLFGLLSINSAYHNSNAMNVCGWLIASIVIVLIAFVTPGLLTPLNKAWMKLGDVMGMIVSPLVLGIIFFFLITPVAIIGRMFCRDELRLKKANVNSYWITRLPPGPAGDSFKNQF
jgi:hypothetical protein